MCCRGHIIKKVVDDNGVVYLSEEMFDSVIEELNNSIPIDWILNHERFPTKESFKKVIEDMIDDWKIVVEEREEQMKLCDSCEHANIRQNWCKEFKCPIQYESSKITRCFGYEPKSFTNLFEAYEQEKKWKEGKKK